MGGVGIAGGYSGSIPTLDQVLEHSDYYTIELLALRMDDATLPHTFLQFQDNLGAGICTVTTNQAAPNRDLTFTSTLATYTIKFATDQFNLTQRAGGFIAQFGGSAITFGPKLQPQATGTTDIGIATAVWQDLYIEVVKIYDTTGVEFGLIYRDLNYLHIEGGTGGFVQIGEGIGDYELLIAAGTVQVKADIYSTADGTHELGLTTRWWQKIWGDDLNVQNAYIWDSTHVEYAAITRTLTQLIINSYAATLEIHINSIRALTIDAANSIDVYKTDGTSRYWHEYMISAFSTSPGAAGATLTPPSANTLGGYQLDAAEELLYINSHVEDDWDGGSDLIVEIIWECNVNNGGGLVTDTVDLRLICYYKGDGEVTNKTQTLEEAVVVGQCAQFTQFKTTFTIDYNPGLGHDVDAGDTFGLILNLETDTSEVDDIIINLIEFKYKTAKPQLEVT